MRNKKIIALFCALSMIVAMFASFTVANAADAAMTLTKEQKDENSATITVKYDKTLLSEGFDTFTVSFDKPVGVKATATEAVSGGMYDINGGETTDNYLSVAFMATKTCTADDGVLTVITLQAPEGGFESNFDVVLDNTSQINLTTADDSEYSVENGKLVVEKVTIQKDPNAPAPKEPISKPDITEADKPEAVTPVEVNVTGGITLSDPVKKSDGVYEVTAKYVSQELDTNGLDTFTVSFDKPVGITVEASESVAGGMYDINGGAATDNYMSVAFMATKLVKPENGVLTVLTFKYPSEGLDEDVVIQLDNSSQVSNTETGPAIEVGSQDYPLAQVTVTLPSSVVDNREVTALKDKFDPEVVKTIETTADDEAYLAIEVTKDNGGEVRYGEDYEAYYNGVKLTEAQLNNLLAGAYADDEEDPISLADAAKGIVFKYNDGVNIRMQLVADGTVVSEETTEEATPGTGGKDLSADGKIASKVSKSIKSNASKQKATFTVTPAKDKDGNVIVSDAPYVTITVKKSSYDAITGSGIEVAYTDYEIEDTDDDDDYEEAAVKTKTYYVYPSIQEADTEITLPDSVDYKYDVSFTPAAKGTVEYTMTYYDANGKKAEATAKYTISEASTKSSGSSGSGSDSKSSGGGAIATGLVDTGAGYLPSLGFDDLGDVEWAQTAINSLAAKKIVSGVGDNKFDPNAALTRAAYAQMLVNAIGHSQDSADVEFADVPTDSWFYHNVAVAAQLGIVSGYGDGNFGPYDLITREQMALMTQKAAVVMGNSLIGADNGTFTDDADIADWAHDAVYTLSNAGIINGMGDGTFAPKANATRAQAAVIIYNTFVK